MVPQRGRVYPEGDTDSRLQAAGTRLWMAGKGRGLDFEMLGVGGDGEGDWEGWKCCFYG